MKSVHYQSGHYNVANRNTQIGFEIPDEHSATNTKCIMCDVNFDHVFCLINMWPD